MHAHSPPAFVAGSEYEHLLMRSTSTHSLEEVSILNNPSHSLKKTSRLLCRSDSTLCSLPVSPVNTSSVKLEANAENGCVNATNLSMDLTMTMSMTMSLSLKSHQCIKKCDHHGHSASAITTGASCKAIGNILDSNDNSNKNNTKRFQLYTIHEVPEFLKDNEFILSGYRAHYSFIDTLISVFHIHNETGNIWSHIIGACFMLYLIGSALNGGLPANASLMDRFMVIMSLTAAFKCLFCSSLFHSVYCHSEHTFGWSGCLDYMGISVAICSTFLTITYFLFHDNIAQFGLYASAIVVTSLAGVVGPIFPIWATPVFRSWRALVYVLSALVSSIPVVHFFAVADLSSTQYLGFWGREGWLVIIAIYLVGVTIYVYRLPERIFPGKCDIFIQSHQIWHVAVVIGMYLQYLACVELLKWRIIQEA